MVRKETNNPLKMYEVWIGGFLALAIFLFFVKPYWIWANNVFGNWLWWGSGIGLLIFFIIPYAIFNIGAFLGLGIHYLLKGGLNSSQA